VVFLKINNNRGLNMPKKKGYGKKTNFKKGTTKVKYKKVKK
tara:strand:- start:6 stop:128 length:123 start_codon:yes stop_codon:yes gene_type:complete